VFKIGRRKKEPRPRIAFREYGRVAEYLRPYKLQFLLLTGVSLLSTGVTLAQPYLTKLLIDDALQHHSFRSLRIFASWMGICSLLSFGTGIITTYLYTKTSAAILFDMRLMVFRKLQALSPQFFATTKTGDIVSRINNDISELQRLSSDTLLSLPMNCLFMIGNAALMIYLNWALFLVSVAMVPAGIWAMNHYGHRLRTQVRTLREQSADIGSFLIEAILGMRLVVRCNAQARKDVEFRGHNQRFVNSLLSMQLTSFLAGALPGAVLTLSVAILFLYGGSLVIRGVMTIGSLMAFMAYHGRLLSPVQSLMGTYSALITGSVSLSRIFELLDKPNDVKADLDALPVKLSKGDVRLANVSFEYSGRTAVLREVSFQIAARSICVIVGASGAGKSTLIDLLMRFYDPSAGAISIDEHDLRQLRITDLREAVATVDQLPFFFHSTIRENLLFAAPQASLEELNRAVEAAGLQPLIASLPLAYETLLGERGLTLSAGQRQRLAIARALLRSPAVLLLDEPTAALDPEAEYALIQTLRRVSINATVIVATHRPALMEIADQVVLLKDGRVVEAGAPAELVNANSELARHFGDFSREKTALVQQ
jgi:ATP-binding cassette, subfamily B, bacterial